MRSAIEKSSSELQVILDEVLRLPERKRNELASLLKDVSLAAIISAAKIVADRLDFLVALEAILFDEGPKARLKECTQLHKLVAKHAWIFGEEYNISVNDRSLTEVLKQHPSCWETMLWWSRQSDMYQRNVASLTWFSLVRFVDIRQIAFRIS